MRLKTKNTSTILYKNYFYVAVLTGAQVYHLGSYAPTLIKADSGSTSLGSNKLLIKSIQMKYDSKGLRY